MTGIFLFVILFFVLVMLVVMTYQLRSVEHKHKATEDDPLVETNEKALSGIIGSQEFVYTAIVLTGIGLVASIYLLVRGTVWEGHLMEWLNIVVRL
ncbi:MAG TPA: hypothetical protein DCQ34_03030, partial [Chitinophagaceae bacterium]|nr:hypothetical protein [Chitinophagaceae bacterium]